MKSQRCDKDHKSWVYSQRPTLYSNDVPHNFIWSTDVMVPISYIQSATSPTVTPTPIYLLYPYIFGFIVILCFAISACLSFLADIASYIAYCFPCRPAQHVPSKNSCTSRDELLVEWTTLSFLFHLSQNTCRIYSMMPMRGAPLSSWARLPTRRPNKRVNDDIGSEGPPGSHSSFAPDHPRDELII